MEKSRNKEKSLTRAGVVGAAAVSLWVGFYCQGFDQNLDFGEGGRRKWVCMNDVEEPPRIGQPAGGNISGYEGYLGTRSYSTSTVSGTNTTTTTTL